MIKICIIAILVLFSIIIGFFPTMEDSPLEWIKIKLGYEEKIHFSFQIIVGVILYISAAVLSQI